VCEVIECVLNLVYIDHHIHVVCNTAPIDDCRLITGWIDVGGVHYGVSRLTIESECPFCNSDHGQKTTEERVAEITNRVVVNDASAMCALAKSSSPWVGRFTRRFPQGHWN